MPRNALNRKYYINSGNEAAEPHIIYKHIKEISYKCAKLNVWRERRVVQEI
jgi:hypothetical protein